MTEDDGFRVTNRDVYNALLEFKKEFNEYMKEKEPKITLLEYKVAELEQKQKLVEEHGFTEKQTRRLYLWGFAGSSVLLEIANFILFHK